MSLVLVAISVLKELQEVHLQLPIVKGVRMTPTPESAFIESGLTAAQDKLQHQVKTAMMEPLEWMQGIQ